MASYLKGIKKSTLTDEMRKALYLQQWVQQTFDLFVSKSTISNTLKRSSEYLSKEIKNRNVKRHKSTKYPELEKVLYEWFLQYQEKVNMTREIIQIKAKELLQKMYGDANSKFNFSIGWLERFKARHGIKSYRRFGESSSVVMENIEDALPQIRAKLEIFYWKDIYNMDETGLFYRLQADHSLATKQIEGRKKDKEKTYYCGLFILKGYEKGKINLEKINVSDTIHFFNVAWNIDVKPTTIAIFFRHYKIRFEEDMPLEQEIGDVEGIHKLKEVISNLHYRNALDVEQILNYPSDNESLRESPADEEIIQGVMDVPADDEQDPNDSSKNISDLVYALLKIKNEIVFDSHVKKKQLTIYAYFSKE
ncbi:hypothetical protein ES288_D10G171600v1 [Gossypium darwinii]|uniref:HTH CENPB-type domain-containing protein n=1 Tax=Gossypium darwinii TaxID=34276 RepID=A0A5D2B0R9_GOSDA|nr:hypothetical protein ES288_D10G171600v1 [Gossypium darwinii]